MQDFFVRFSIPEELESYQKLLDTKNKPNAEYLLNLYIDVVKKSDGTIQNISYYSENNKLKKRVFYSYSSIERIEHYFDGKISYIEYFNGTKLEKKVKYKENEEFDHTIFYEYDKKNNITKITKSCNISEYSVIYGYDELTRINARTILINDEIVLKQRFRYDVRDRVIQYKDDNQTFEILRISNDNKLLAYRIFDIAGNDVIIENCYAGNIYEHSIISINGHSKRITDKNYCDNIILKQPYTSEDDLDFVIASLYNSSKENIAEKNISTHFNESESIKLEQLPISIRKRALLYF